MNLDPLLDRSINQISNRLSEIEYKYLANAGKSIAQILAMSNEELRTFLYSGGVLDLANHDLARIRRELNAAHRANVQEMKQLARNVTATVYEEGADIAEAKGETISPKKAYTAAVNPLLAGVMRNYEIMSKSVAINDTYKKTITRLANQIMSDDDRISAPSALRKAVADLNQEGISFVDFRNGRKMRLDSAVRNSLFTEMTNIVHEVSNKVGEELGSQHTEVSAHIAPADDHADIQGQVFENSEFEKLQAGEIAEDIDGNKHQTIRPIGFWNCKHVIFPFFLGISERAYEQKDLNNYLKNNEKGIEWNGERISLYDATQVQRRIETELRRNRGALEIVRQVAGVDPAFQHDKSVLNRRIKGLRAEYDRLGDILKPHAIRSKAERSYNIAARANR